MTMSSNNAATHSFPKCLLVPAYMWLQQTLMTLSVEGQLFRHDNFRFGSNSDSRNRQEAAVRCVKKT